MKKTLIIISLLGLFLLLSCNRSKRLQNDEYNPTDSTEWEDSEEENFEEEVDTLYMEPDTLDPEDTLIIDTLKNRTN